MRKTLFLPLLVLLLWQVPSYADSAQDAEYERGAKARVEGDQKTAFREAFEIWKALAENGHVKSQDRIAWLYYYGEGVTQNYEKAAEWWHKAAKQGYVHSQFYLGYFMYWNGKGVPQSLTDAYMWISIAKANGRESGQNLLYSLEERLNSNEIEQAKAKTKRCLESNYKDCD